MPIELRDAVPADAPAIQAIYAHHVLHGTASYDIEPPPVEATRAKLEWIAGSGWPYLAATAGGKMIGYSYVTQVRDRAAYRFASENSIYVHPGWMGRGVGKRLLTELCARAEARGFRQVVAVIGGAEEPSVRLHAACGFAKAGRLRAVGWKSGRWLDSLYMQKALGPGSAEPPPD